MNNRGLYSYDQPYFSKFPHQPMLEMLGNIINSKTNPSAVTDFPASWSEHLLFCQPARFLWGTDKVRNRFVECPWTIISQIYLTFDIPKFTFSVRCKDYQWLWCCPRAFKAKTFRFVAEQTVNFNGNRELCWVYWALKLSSNNTLKHFWTKYERGQFSNLGSYGESF